MQKFKRLKEQKAITLVALVITIIVLLILAGISIQAITNTGLFAQAENAKRESEIANIKEQISLDIYEKQLEPPVGSITEEQLETILGKYGTVNKEDGKIVGITTEKGYEILLSDIYSGTTEEAENPVDPTPEPTPDPSLPTNPATTIAEAQEDYMLTKTVNSPIQDAYGNKITIPAGFKIKVDSSTNNATTVDNGIVIIDSNENEFVWIPVGKIYTDIEKTEDNAKTIELNRYKFDSTTGDPSAYSGSYVEEDSTDTANLKNYGNIIAKDINTFKTKASATQSGGFYIGRYEAGVTGYDANAITTSNSNSETSWTGYTNAEGEELKLVCKAGQQVWNYVTQNKAADLARNMYGSDKPFTSDLINSYAWDTAIVFEQTFDDRADTTKPYSRQNSLNTGSPAATGTTDKICNIYDMASNVAEWTTETYSGSSGGPCGRRGGFCNNSSYCTSTRGSNSTSNSSRYLGFRPLLYV